MNLNRVGSTLYGKLCKNLPGVGGGDTQELNDEYEAATQRFNK